MPQDPTNQQPTAGQAILMPQTQLNSINSDPSNQKLQAINREFKEKEAVRKAKESGLGYINIAVAPINPDLLRLIPPDIAQSALILPFFRIGKKVRVAVADPDNAQTQKAIEDLKQQGYAINVNVATTDGLQEAMKLYKTEQYKIKTELDTSVEEEKIKAYEKEIEDLKNLQQRIKTVTSEEALYLLNVGAFKTNASDIHCEPEEKSVTIRLRIDGILHKVFEIENAVFTNIANQIKYKCKMKLNINNEPQDGRFNFTVNERKIDVRVSALPTEFGETFVMRLLDSGRHIAEFEEIGFSGENLAKVKKLLNLKHGMILMTGPTGSGKTTTLYTLLAKFNAPEKKIITLEDPIEYHLKGISQSQINEKRGYDFANGLRAILRQDPDIVMLGEIRDLETAETAAQASLTGHILLATLHTNSAIEAITRLVNIGLPAFMVAPAIDTIIAQRLVRKFCPKCVQQKPIEKSTLEELQRVVEYIEKVRSASNTGANPAPVTDPALAVATKIQIPEQLPYSPGCEVCSHTGYKGRLALIELLEVDSEIKALILEKASSTALLEAARRKGLLTMYEDGILKVIQGETSLQEVHRVTTLAA